MIGTRRILAVVPARGGSQGVPLKNLRPILGVPMVARVGHVVRCVPAIDRAVVSTDHEGIALAAVESGLEAPFRRPAELSGPRIGDWDVLAHALQEMEVADEVTYDIIVMLQPTSPLRRPEHVRAALDMLVAGGWDAVWTVSESDTKFHPLKQLKLDHSKLDYYDVAGASVVARQQLQPLYHRNGVAYAITRDCLMQQHTIKGARTGALVLDGLFVSIDTEWDIELAELVMRRQRWQEPK